MKTLFLIRHAKSDWDNPLLQDIERPLNERGYTAANLMSLRLNAIPDLIITSPAVRAASTALIFARNLGYDPNAVLIKKELYDSSVKDYLSVIKQIDDRFQTVLLFAHNPTISDTADQLTKGLPMEMPTCAVAGIRFGVESWSKVKPKAGDLFLFDYPKKNGQDA
jgi:phosphohistidine phosphatase